MSSLKLLHPLEVHTHDFDVQDEWMQWEGGRKTCGSNVWSLMNNSESGSKSEQCRDEDYRNGTSTRRGGVAEAEKVIKMVKVAKAPAVSCT